jgi:2-polyprenyl-6-methoxyphenol hydroxylase-like FAD-dependent oxidoreductase
VSPVSRVLIIGGGIGGLTAATAFAQRGVEVDVLEIKPDFGIRGVGLGQPANALRALRAIGVLDECLAAGFQFDRLRLCDYNGDLVVEHRFRLGGPGLPAMNALPRIDLHRILIGAATRAGATIRLGATVAATQPEGKQVGVVFSDGPSQRYDLVVGFDGNGSSTRRWLFGDAYEPEPYGYGAWRVIVDRPPEITTMAFFQGLGSKTGVMPLTRDRMYLFHICPEPVDAWYDPVRFLEFLRERIAGYGGIVAEVMARLTRDHEIVYSPLQPLMVPDPWYRGRVLIAGDAAHACPPHMTQGAGMAMEDGIVLAECVTTNAPVEAQLREFMDRRYERTAFVQRFSRQMLAAEQAIRTEEQLRAARAEMQTTLSERLAAADRLMNASVLEADRLAEVATTGPERRAVAPEPPRPGAGAA